MNVYLDHKEIQKMWQYFHLEYCRLAEYREVVGGILQKLRNVESPEPQKQVPKTLPANTEPRRRRDSPRRQNQPAVEPAFKFPKISESRETITMKEIEEQRRLERERIYKEASETREQIETGKRYSSRYDFLLNILTHEDRLLSAQEIVTILLSSDETPRDIDVEKLTQAIRLTLDQMAGSKKMLGRVYIKEKRCAYYGHREWFSEGRPAGTYLDKLNRQLLFPVFTS